jgi:carotenoid cleavage dioxygenase-like enzyme
MAHRLGLQTFSDECHDRALPVTGTIPDWLDGTLLRNGPGAFEVGGEPVSHWFDGLALLRRFAISDGQVAYSARFLESEAYSHVQREGELGYMEFGTTPDSLAGQLRQFAGGEATDNACVDVTRIGGAVAAALSGLHAWIAAGPTYAVSVVLGLYVHAVVVGAVYRLLRNGYRSVLHRRRVESS